MARPLKLLFLSTLSVLLISCATQREYISVLKDMPRLVKEKKPKAPTIFIIGGVVSLREKLKWYTTNVGD